MATTPGAIRDAMIALVAAIDPATHGHQPFRAHREQMDFREWAEANPSSCLRRFSIMFTGDREAPLVTNGLVEEVSETVDVLVAYPNDSRHGVKPGTSVADVATSDIRQIHHALHVANSPAGATVLRLADSRDISGPVTFAVIRYRVDYFWSLT